MIGVCDLSRKVFVSGIQESQIIYFFFFFDFLQIFSESCLQLAIRRKHMLIGFKNLTKHDRNLSK